MPDNGNLPQYAVAAGMLVPGAGPAWHNRLS